MRDLIEVLFGASSGFGFFQLFTSPSHRVFIDKTSPKLAEKLSKFKRKVYNKFVRDIRAKKFEILPSVRFQHKDKQIHIHHWITLSALLGLLLYRSEGLTQLTMIKSFMAGGAIQGLLYKDRFKIVKKLENTQPSNSKVPTTGK